MTADGWKPFGNLRITYTYETYSYLDATRPAESQLYKPDFHHPSATLTVGSGLPRPSGSEWDLGLAGSFGYERLSNAEDLPLYDVTNPTNVVALPGIVGLTVSKDNQSARFGQIKAVNVIPLSVSFVAKVPSGWFDKTVQWLPGTPHGPNEKYELIPGVYGRGLIRDLGKPDEAIGITLTMRRITIPKDAKTEVDRIKGEKWTYPFHIFLEAKNTFNSKKDDFRAGASILVSIP